MRKIILTLLFFSTFFANAQYCIFFEFEAKEPEMVVSTLKGMMETDWGKNLQATKSLFAYLFNGDNKATHSVQFCFQDEEGVASFMSSWAQSSEAQLFGEKLGKFTTEISQSVNTPAWYKNDWGNDNAFMMYQMKVSDPGLYLKEFMDFSQKIAKKLKFEENSYGVAYPIIGRTKEFSHFVWIGSPDIKTALANTKKMFSDPAFAEFSKNVSRIREVVNTYLMVRVMDF
jgi:hypothetical protein|tara:strand:+ start:1310 stop:1996 length:687 start_codon:yes stop_codon:yes gene_type:complete